MGLEQSIPKVWFIRTDHDVYGNVCVQVIRNIAGAAPQEDRKFTVLAQTPRWMFWMKPFQVRLDWAVDAARKRAYELNQDYARARGAVYRLEHPDV
jgi:hypothetical protein